MATNNYAHRLDLRLIIFQIEITDFVVKSLVFGVENKPKIQSDLLNQMALTEGRQPYQNELPSEKIPFAKYLTLF